MSYSFSFVECLHTFRRLTPVQARNFNLQHFYQIDEQTSRRAEKGLDCMTYQSFLVRQPIGYILDQRGKKQEGGADGEIRQVAVCWTNQCNNIWISAANQSYTVGNLASLQQCDLAYLNMKKLSSVILLYLCVLTYYIKHQVHNILLFSAQDMWLDCHVMQGKLLMNHEHCASA